MEDALASCFFSEVVMYMFDVEDKSNVAEDLSVEASSQVVTKVIIYTPEVQHSPWKMMVGRLLSFWDGKISGATLNFQGVLYIYIVLYIPGTC